MAPLLRPAGALLLAAAAWTASSVPQLGVSPRGWNSYDNGASTEAEVLAAAQYVADNLASYGYDHIVMDGGWYDGNGPVDISLDQWGRPVPWPQRFPSGFKAIADKVHGMGLKFGAWLMRGVPLKAVNARMPIWNSTYTADEAVRMDRNCSWSGENLGTNSPSPAADAWLRSIAALYVDYGLDFVKIDCMYGPGSPGDPVYTEDLVAFARAFADVNITVSYSPGSWVTTHNGSMIAAGGYGVTYR
jgi:alpha-galactosidase